MKYLGALCLVIVLALSGCAKKKETLVVTKEEVMIKKLPIAGMQAEPTEKSAVQTADKAKPQTRITLGEGEILISDFESWPNNLGGEIGVYGSLEPNWDEIALIPYSWSYEPVTPGYDDDNVHSGRQSFRLVNALGSKKDLAWGSFSMDLGPTIDLTVIPKKVESLDVAGYKYLTFWVKGVNGGEKMELLIRDAHALNYMPQVKYKLPDATTQWQKIVIPLDEIAGKVDLTKLDNIGIAFGKDVGNMQGEIIFLDDFAFTNIK